VVRYTREHGCAGVICGHIHVPAIRRVEGIDYFNCGDWVEHCTALVEHVDGRIELVGTPERVGHRHGRNQSEMMALVSSEPSTGSNCQARPVGVNSP
jgi:hypothetical protein